MRAGTGVTSRAAGPKEEVALACKLMVGRCYCRPVEAYFGGKGASRWQGHRVDIGKDVGKTLIKRPKVLGCKGSTGCRGGSLAHAAIVEIV